MFSATAVARFDFLCSDDIRVDTIPLTLIQGLSSPKTVGFWEKRDMLHRQRVVLKMEHAGKIRGVDKGWVCNA
jgi:hypothetical protein